MTIPIFIFDSEEKWFPVGVEESLSAVGVKIPNTSTPSGRLDFPQYMKPPDLPPVGYQRSVFGGNLWWDQRWLWYPYNSWNIGGVGEHEGDWEFVQIGHADQKLTKPVLITGSQHHSGEAKLEWTVTHQGNRPVIFVARGSHANYFAPFRNLDDRCDGQGQALKDITWRSFGTWVDWKGQWGNSTGEGKSPMSPKMQGMRWHSPHLYHSRARAT